MIVLPRHLGETMGMIKHGSPEPAEVEESATDLTFSDVKFEQVDPSDPPAGAFRIESTQEPDAAPEE